MGAGLENLAFGGVNSAIYPCENMVLKSRFRWKVCPVHSESADQLPVVWAEMGLGVLQQQPATWLFVIVTFGRLMLEAARINFKHSKHSRERGDDCCCPFVGSDSVALDAVAIVGARQ